MEKYAVIVAGGMGLRMGGAIPKQFLEIGKYPVLMHTLDRFYQFDADIHLIVVLPKNQISEWESLCAQYKFNRIHQVVAGGETRFHSVKNGLQHVPDNCLVAIHDGVRPFVSDDTLSRCFAAADEMGTAIPVIPLVDSLRSVDKTGNKSENRNRFCLVQTPQTFRADMLKAAFGQVYKEEFTDDASVAEAYGEKMTLVEGNRENIKITTPFDLTIANALLNEKSTDFLH